MSLVHTHHMCAARSFSIRRDRFVSHRGFSVYRLLPISNRCIKSSLHVSIGIGFLLVYRIQNPT